MATRTKTTIWGFPSDIATIANATTRTLTTQTVYAENTSRVFRGAIVDISYMGTCIAINLSSVAVGVSVGGATYTTITKTDDWTASGELFSGLFSFDFTDHFEANFGTGTSQTVDIQVTTTYTSNPSPNEVDINVGAVLRMTYDFADTDSICVKSIVIPLESNVAGLDTAELTELGTNQIPILTGASGFIKEVSAPTIRDYFFIIEGNESVNSASTDDVTLSVALDSDDAYGFGPEDRASAADFTYRYVWSKKASVPTTTSTHAFKAMCNSAAASHYHMSVKLVVTYEFTRANAVGCTVSIQIPMSMTDLGATTSTDAQVTRFSIDIQEPGTVSLLQSGVQVHYGLSATQSAVANYMYVGVGGQTAVGYSENVIQGLVGDINLLHRFDSGAAAGAGVTLARGQNSIDVVLYSATSRSASSLCGTIYLNYSTTSVPSTGIDSCNHTICFPISDLNLLIATHYSEVAEHPVALIADSLYYLQSVGFYQYLYVNGTTGTFRNTLYAEVLSGEGTLGVGDGWLDLGALKTFVTAFVEAGQYYCIYNNTCEFKKHPGHPDTTKLDVEGSRKFRIDSNRTGYSLYSCVTYHSIVYTATGVVSGYAGTGAVTVKVHDLTSGEHLYTFTASVGGNYTATIYDNTRDHYSEVYEDSTHVGRSANWKAT